MQTLFFTLYIFLWFSSGVLHYPFIETGKKRKEHLCSSHKREKTRKKTQQQQKQPDTKKAP